MRLRSLARVCLAAAAFALSVAAVADAELRQQGPAAIAGQAMGSMTERAPRQITPRTSKAKAALGSINLPAPTPDGKPSHTGNLMVKFNDGVLARIDIPTGTIYSQAGDDMTECTSVIYASGARVEPMLKLDHAELQKIQEVATRRSGKAQPDLAGFYFLKVPEGSLVPLARALTQLPQIEVVEIETKVVQTSSPDDDGGLAGTNPTCSACGTCPDPDVYSCFNAHVGGFCANAPCCNAVITVNPACSFDWDAACVQTAIGFQANDGPCADGCDGCGDAACLPCQDAHAPQIYCRDNTVCVLVSGIRPGCNITGWDEVCAALSNFLGTPSVFGTPPGTVAYDTCLQPFDAPFTPPGPYYEESVMFSGHAFQAHVTGGAIVAECCRAVCFFDATCCSIAWDADCAGIAMGFDPCYWTDGYSVAPIPGGGSGTPNDPFTQSQSPLFSSAMLEDAPPVGVAAGSAALGIWDTQLRIPDPYSGPNPPPTPPNWGALQTFADVSLFRGGGFDMATLTEIIDRFNATGLAPLTHGASVKVALVDFSAFLNHEDLMVNGVSVINLEPGVEPLLFGLADPGSATGFEELIPTAHHGTAALGMLFGQDNLIGVTGLCTSAEPWFFPAMSTTDYNRLSSAIVSAVGELADTADPNDPFPSNVMVIPLARLSDDPGGQAAFNQPLNTSNIYAQFLQLGLDAGVTIVIPAGNSAVELLEPVAAATAVTVGACWPGFQLFPAASGVDPNALVQAGNNYCRYGTSNWGATSDCTGWGTSVCALGYGDLFLGANAAIASPEEVNQLRTYTARWTGTSPATCMVGGLAAVLQGFAKQTYGGLGLPPDIMQAMFRNPANVFPQCGLSAAQQAGAGPINTVGDTITYLAPPTTLCPVGGFPNVRECGTAVLTGNFFEDSGSTFKIICGKKITGNNFSIQRADGKLLRIRSARPGANQASGGFGPPLSYPPSQRVTDLQVTQPVQGQLDSVSLNLVGRTASSATALVMVYLYNVVTNRWDFMGFEIMNNGPVQQLDFPLLQCQETDNYLDPTGVPNGGNIRARIVTLGQGGGFGQQQEIQWDLVQIDYNNPLIPLPPPCGGAQP